MDRLPRTAGHGPTLSFARVLDGRFDPALVRGRVIVVGATAETLQDVHSTAVGDSELMSGAEIQANAIWTALHGVPLRSVPPLVDWLAIVLLAALVPLARVKLPMLGAAAMAPLFAAAFLAAAYAAFAAGWVVAIVPPLVALVLATVGTVVVGYVVESRARRRAAWEKDVLEGRVREATAELRATQLEVAQRLAIAVESRDTETALHVERMCRLCERVGRRARHGRGRGARRCVTPACCTTSARSASPTPSSCKPRQARRRGVRGHEDRTRRSAARILERLELAARAAWPRRSR